MDGKKSNPSVLRQVMARYFCYTTVFNAIELFSLCRSKKEQRVVEDVMYSMKVLGLNGKSAKSIGLSIAGSRGANLRDVDMLVAGVCLESRLPILTGSPTRYRGIRLLRVVRADEIRAYKKKGKAWS